MYTNSTKNRRQPRRSKAEFAAFVVTVKAESAAWEARYVGTEAEARIREALDYLTPIHEAMVSSKGYIKDGCKEHWDTIVSQSNELVAWSTFGCIKED